MVSASRRDASAAARSPALPEASALCFGLDNFDLTDSAASDRPLMVSVGANHDGADDGCLLRFSALIALASAVSRPRLVEDL